VVVVILCVPIVVFAAISGEVAAASCALLGGLAVVSTFLFGSRPLAYLTVGLLTASTPIAIVSGTVPVAGAALMALMCLGVGLSAARGLHRGMVVIPMYLAFYIIAPPPWSGFTGADRTSTSYLLWNMLFLGGGALWAALVFPRCCGGQRCRRTVRNRGLRRTPWSTRSRSQFCAQRAPLAY
jgi:hypothetical protein